MKAMWNQTLIAQSDDVVEIEGSRYFPLDALVMAYVRPSTRNTVCQWKGMASYFDIVVDGQVNKDAVWTYTHPTARASVLRGRVAFGRGVTLVAD